MKNLRKITFLILACLLLLSNICIATNEPNTDENIVLSNEDTSETANIINTDLYLTGEDVVIDEPTNGNIFVIGNNVTIKSEVNGDVFVMAQNLTVEETSIIYNNIFAITDIFTMSGTAYDVYCLSSEFTLSENGYIYRDLKVFSNLITLNGIIKKDAYIAASEISILENAENIIGGNLHYTSKQEIPAVDSAVEGEVKFTVATESVPTTSEIIASYVSEFISIILLMAVIIIFTIFYAPKFVENSSYFATKKPFLTAGIGILALVLIPIISIILMITGFLSYVGLGLFAIYILALCITLAILSLAVAKPIYDKLKNPSKLKFILLSIACAIVIWLLQQVPYIGGYVSLFTLVFGFGIFLRSLFGKKKETV